MGASMLQQLCLVRMCMFTQVSCVAAQFLTLPSPFPVSTAPAVHCTGASRAPLWGQQWALGRDGTQQLAQSQEVLPSVFLLRVIYC